MTTEEKHDAEEHAAYMLGQCVGIEDTAGRLRVRSGELFAQSNDDHARFLRDLAKDLTARAEQMRRAHDEYRKNNRI